MRLTVCTALAAALGLASTTDALKILMGNDDGFGSGNLRELYKLLVDAGHEGKPTPQPSMTTHTNNPDSRRRRPSPTTIRQRLYSNLVPKLHPHHPLPILPHPRRRPLRRPRNQHLKHLVLRRHARSMHLRRARLGAPTLLPFLAPNRRPLRRGPQLRHQPRCLCHGS